MRVGFKSWCLFQVVGDEMAGSTVPGSEVGSRTVLSEPEELCGEKEGGLQHVCFEYLCNGNPWMQLFLEASACLPAHVAGGFALTLNQLLLGVDGKAHSSYAGLVLPGGVRSSFLSLSPPILYSLPCRAVMLL